MKYRPSRFNPHPTKNSELAELDIKAALTKYSVWKPASEYDRNVSMFISCCHRAWSICYTTEMRLEDAAYEVSNLWG